MRRTLRRKLQGLNHLPAARFPGTLLFITLSFLFLCLASQAASTSDVRPASPPSFTNRLTIVILSFENKTGTASNAFWHYEAENLVEMALKEVKRLRVLPNANYALREIHKKSGDSLSVSEATLAGNAIEARRVIWGSYDRKEGKWRLTARILNPANGNVSTELTATAADWFEVRDQMVDKILHQLGIGITAEKRKKMTERPTSSPAAFEYIARAAAMQRGKGSITEIKDLVHRGLAADTNFAWAHIALGAILANDGEMEPAEESMRRALELRPDAESHRYLGEILASRTKFEEAETELQTALRLDPDDVEAWGFLGKMCKARGALDLAVENYQRALRLDPFSADIHARLGEVYALQGLHEQAVAELKLAERLANPDDSDDQYSLALAYDTLHEIPSAITRYENLLAIVRKEGTHPRQLDALETRLKEFKETLIPVYLSAPQPKDYDAAALAKILSEKLSPAELLIVTNPLTSTPEMERWAQTIVAGATNDLEKAQRLFKTLSRHVDEGSQGQRTAQQTFAVWQSPDASLLCQEYAFLYVALSRAVGLKTYQVYVEQECDGRKALHACAAFFTDGKVLLVDPMFRWFGVPHKKFTVLDDLQTMAIYFACTAKPERAEIAVKLESDWEFIRLAAAQNLVNADQAETARKIMPPERLQKAQGWMADAVRASYAFHEGRLSDAVASLKKVVAENPDYPDGYAMLAFIYADQKKWVEARENFRSALLSSSEDKKDNQYRAAIAEIDATIGDVDTTGTNGPVDAIDYLNRANARNSRKDYAAAIADYNNAIKLNPKLTEAFVHRGFCYFVQDKKSEAQADFEEAIRLDPQDADGYGHLGILFEQERRFEGGLKNLRKAVSLGSHDPEVYTHLAWILVEGPELFRDCKEGGEVAKKACVLTDWKDGDPLCILTSAYYCQRDFDSAAKTAKLALAVPNLDPASAELLHKVVDKYGNVKVPGDTDAQTGSASNSGTAPSIDFDHLKKLAQQGETLSQVRLATRLYTGDKAPVDHVEAYKWAAVAAAKGDRDAIALQRELDLFLAPAEIASGKTAAAAFLKETAKAK